jgi:hypothetical protein
MPREVADVMQVDWLGPATWIGPDEGIATTSEIIDDAVTLVSLRATRDLSGLATGSFTRLAAGWRFDPQRSSAPEGLRPCGFGLAEFALPARTDRTFARWVPQLPHRPAAVLPVLLIDPDGDTILLAPLDGAHEQCFAADENGPAWGWHGDLDEVPAGFTSTLAIVRGAGPRAVLERWGRLVGARSPRSRRYADALGRKPSYWTDNGAAYWYRTEPGHDVTGGLAATVDDLRSRGVPIGAVQLDSWWYPHEVLRPFDTDEWLVPPTGLVRWEPRDDVLPGGIAPLRDALGGPPLVAHCRHLASASPYVAETPCWIDGERAHPQTTELYERWLDQCVAWGVETFEHDWLVECFTGVRALRAGAGRAAAWQRGVHQAALDRGLTLQWCMAAPADMILAASLPAVTSVRTSGDSGYLVGPGFLWAWFLIVNALARALGLVPFKDVFLAGGPHAAFEALLSSLSAGPVGIGDRLGKADPAIVAPCHRADGLLVKPDEPVAALDRCFSTAWPIGTKPRLLVGDALTRHAAGIWRYVVVANPSSDGSVNDGLSRDELGGDLAWDWSAGRFVTADELRTIQLDPLGWRYFVVPPLLLGGRLAVIGDPRLHATAGDARIGEVEERDGVVRITVLGAGETVELVGWSAEGGIWQRSVVVPARGWITIDVAAATTR